LPAFNFMHTFLSPEKIIKSLRLKKDAIAADFGSGAGGWAIPLAKKLEDGQVYAIDILQEPLSALKSKADLEGIDNIQTIVADVEEEQGSTLDDDSVDFVLVSNILFQAEEGGKVLKEAKRVLRKKGLLLVVDWTEDSSFGPQEGKVSQEKIKETAKELGFNLKKELDAGEHHYALLFEKI